MLKASANIYSRPFFAASLHSLYIVNVTNTCFKFTLRDQMLGTDRYKPYVPVKCSSDAAEIVGSLQPHGPQLKPG